VAVDAPAQATTGLHGGSWKAPHVAPLEAYASQTLLTMALTTQDWPWPQVLVAQVLPAAGGGAHVPHVPKRMSEQ
jgi:hypothetical protein